MGEPLLVNSMIFDLNAWLKTAQGKVWIDGQKPAVAMGEIVQGYQGACYRTDESQLTDAEIEKLDDLDGTKDQVWFKRKQRLESAFTRKSEEYSNRRSELRSRANEIYEAAERRQKLGLGTSPSDKEDLQQIDLRLERLSLTSERASIETAAEAQEPPPPKPDKLETLCGVITPADAEDPEKWRRGHQMGCKKCKAIREGKDDVQGSD